QRVLALGARVAEGDVEPVRGGPGRAVVDALAHPPPLVGGPGEDRAAAGYVLVVRLGRSRATLGDDRAPVARRGELDDVLVGEELEEEGLDRVEVLRPPEVEHHDAGGASGPGAVCCGWLVHAVSRRRVPSQSRGTR